MSSRLKALLVVVLALIAAYVVMFGQALRQDAPHLAALKAMPVALFDAARVSDGRYLARSNDDFVKAMRQEGFEYREQLGAGFVFMKGGRAYVSESEQYSRYFRLYAYPVEQ